MASLSSAAVPVGEAYASMTVSAAPSSRTTTVEGKTAWPSPPAGWAIQTGTSASTPRGTYTKTPPRHNAFQSATNFDSSARTEEKARCTSSGCTSAASSRVVMMIPCACSVSAPSIGAATGESITNAAVGAAPSRWARIASTTALSTWSTGANRSGWSAAISVRRQSSSRCDEGIGIDS